MELIIKIKPMKWKHFRVLIYVQTKKNRKNSGTAALVFENIFFLNWLFPVKIQSRDQISTTFMHVILHQKRLNLFNFPKQLPFSKKNIPIPISPHSWILHLYVTFPLWKWDGGNNKYVVQFRTGGICSSREKL